MHHFVRDVIFFHKLYQFLRWLIDRRNSRVRLDGSFKTKDAEYRWWFIFCSSIACSLFVYKLRNNWYTMGRDGHTWEILICHPLPMFTGISIMARAQTRCIRKRDQCRTEWILIGFFFKSNPDCYPLGSPHRQSRQPFSRRPAGNVKRALYVAISRFRSSEHNDEGGRPFLLKGNP